MSSQPIEMVVTDLDGTLWPSEGLVPAATRDALLELDRRGIPVLAATGRRLRSARLGVGPRRAGPRAVCRPQRRAGRGSGTRSSTRRPSPSTTPVRSTTSSSREASPRSGISCPNVTATASTPSPPRESRPIPITWRCWRRRCRRCPIDFTKMVAFSVLGVPYASLDPIRATIEQQRAADCVLSPDRAYGDHNLAATARGVSKWTGVLAYCARYGIDTNSCAGDRRRRQRRLDVDERVCRARHDATRRRPSAGGRRRDGRRLDAAARLPVSDR